MKIMEKARTIFLIVRHYDSHDLLIRDIIHTQITFTRRIQTSAMKVSINLTPFGSRLSLCQIVSSRS